MGESTEDDVFEENARKERVANSSKKHQNGSEDKGGKEGEEEGRKDGPVTEQPVPPPAMAAPAITVTEPAMDEAK